MAHVRRAEVVEKIWRAPNEKVWPWPKAVPQAAQHLMDPLPGDTLSERMSLGADSLEARTAESEGSPGGPRGAVWGPAERGATGADVRPVRSTAWTRYRGTR